MSVPSIMFIFAFGKTAELGILVSKCGLKFSILTSTLEGINTDGFYLQFN